VAWTPGDPRQAVHGHAAASHRAAARAWEQRGCGVYEWRETYMRWLPEGAAALLSRSREGSGCVTGVRARRR
jgi:hypothetical protein